MFIYLLRHAIAVDRADASLPNDDRPLTKDGREKMEKGAQGIKRLLTEPIDLILTSPLVRASDTAQIAARALGSEDKVKVCTELAPGTPFDELREAVAKFKESEHIMLVGHNPDLTYTASMLLGSEAAIVDLKKGALCCIEIASLRSPVRGTLLWLLQPKQLRQLARS